MRAGAAVNAEEPAAGADPVVWGLRSPEGTGEVARSSQHNRGRACLRQIADVKKPTSAPARLPPSVHSDSRYRVWERRFYPYGVYSEKKRLEKLNYMHNNPVKRGLVRSPEEWPWSSFRFYYLNDTSLLSMDKLV